MARILITFRSVTHAQQAQRLLQRKGIETVLRRTPRCLSSQGCGYCLYVRQEKGAPAVKLLRDESVAFVRVYAQSSDGNVRELAL